MTRRNRQDTTLRNLTASKKREAVLARAIMKLIANDRATQRQLKDIERMLLALDKFATRLSLGVELRFQSIERTLKP